jgi:hypothetical protein
LVNLGDFAPFLVAFNGTSLGHGRYSNTITSLTNEGDGGNQFGLGLLGNHAITDDIKLNWGIGYFRLVEEQFRNQDRYLGLEVDLGFTFQILENLAFETQFGYMWNGPAYDIGNRKVDNTFAWANFLTVSF